MGAKVASETEWNAVHSKKGGFLPPLLEQKFHGYPEPTVLLKRSEQSIALQEVANGKDWYNYILCED